MAPYLALGMGVLLAFFGGELFVRGVVGLASWTRVSPGIMAATLAAFATSSPELTVSVIAALEGTPRIALGDALGSSVVNVALILGVALSAFGFRARGAWHRDFSVASAVPVIIGGMVLDGVLSRANALILLGCFLLWLIGVIREARQQRRATPEQGPHHPGRAAAQGALGLVLLVAAGRFIVSGASDIAEDFGVDPFIIGATVVALGTSVPEIATTIIAAVRGHHEVGFGTVLGSNIFNGFFIVAVASLIAPIAVDVRELAVVLGFGLAAMALAFPGRGGFVGRWRGVLLLLLYAIYLFTEVTLER